MNYQLSNKETAMTTGEAKSWLSENYGPHVNEYALHLLARVAELEAALRPFADAYHKWSASEIDSPIYQSGYLFLVGIPLRIEPYQAAAAALGEDIED